MPPGGARQGKPQQAYPNRSDLSGTQPVQAATGQAYGEAGRQRLAQAAMPLPQGAPADMKPPGSLGGLTRGTENPNEPITSGLPMGPGPGPEVLANTPDDAVEFLRGLYLRYPLDELREIIEQA